MEVKMEAMTPRAPTTSKIVDSTSLALHVSKASEEAEVFELKKPPFPVRFSTVTNDEDPVMMMMMMITCTVCAGYGRETVLLNSRETSWMCLCF